MPHHYEIYCKKEDSVFLKDILRDGVEVSKISPADAGYVSLNLIPMKKRGRKRHILLSATEIHEQYNAGTHVSDIAIKAGCTERYIWKILKEERGRQNAKE